MIIIITIVIFHSPTCSIYTDHNSDNTSLILNEWASNARSFYMSVEIDQEVQWFYNNREPFEWHDERITHMCELRQKALVDARLMEADYILVS